MTKHLLKTRWLIALAIVGALVACKGDDDNNPAATTPNNTADAGDGEDADDQTDVVEPDDDVEEDIVVTPREPGAVEEEPNTCDPAPYPERAYSATIRWTSHGVPHIIADDLASATFGQAYAIGRDHACTLAELFVRGRGEQARYFGPGPNGRYVDEDFGARVLRYMDDARCILETLSDDERQILAGYAAGYNKYLEDVGPDGLPEECRGADFVKPIDEVSLLATYLRSAYRASGNNLVSFIVNATTPGGDRKAGRPLEERLKDLPDFRNLGIGSNGWALGRDKTDNQSGMLLSNTHFPWEGELRWHESHLTVPGQYNAYGVGLIGAAGVLIGFNEHIAWTHTVSTSSRFNAYTLKLVEGDPESYLVDGEPRRMTKRTYSVEVLGEDGELTTEERTLFRSHYGPIVDVLGWTATQVLTYRDANAANANIPAQWLAMNRATNMDEFKQSFADIHGIPWVNTLAADRQGNTFYTDASPVPNFSQEAIDVWRQEVANGGTLTATLFNNGIFLFDGSDSRFEWVDEEGSVQPGTVPFSAAPQLDRTDYVANSNDSHWITHHEDLLEGFSPLFGQERIRLPRTQMGLVQLTETGPDSPAGEDGLFTLDELEDMFWQDRALLSERLLPEVVERCTDAPPVFVAARNVELDEACDILAAWDGAYRLNSVGAVLWREFIGNLGGPFNAGPLFANGFDPDNPLTTPNTLPAAPAEGADPILEALALAVVRLEGSRIDIDTPLGDLQYTQKGDLRLPIHGGTDFEGAFNIVDFSRGVLRDNPAGLPRFDPGERVNDDTDRYEDGYPVNRGASFIMFMQFVEGGVSARAVTSYSQSATAASPHYADQTRLFSESRTRPILFTEDEIAADPNLEIVEISVTP